MNPDTSHLTIVIPAYNEDETLEKILIEWLNYCASNNWHLIIVDDGSKDRTLDILYAHAQNSFLQVFHHNTNRGYGRALKTGIQASQSPFTATMDADGQHQISAIKELLRVQNATDSDLVIGKRVYPYTQSHFRNLGKFVIRIISRLLIPHKIQDLNSGMKLYRTEMVRSYLDNCPNTMAFSDVITLSFLADKQLVSETPVPIAPRQKGTSTINIKTAFDTIFELFNIVMFFNPMRLFLPLAGILLLAGIGWGLPIVLAGRGVSVGSLLLIFAGGLCILLGLIAEQLSQLRKLLAKQK
jgi:glycosyltransferase involved in cell wall biosynthesis